MFRKLVAKFCKFAVSSIDIRLYLIKFLVISFTAPTSYACPQLSLFTAFFWSYLLLLTDST